MANTYTNEVTASQSTTQQTRIVRCFVSVQLNAGDTVTVVTTNSVPVALQIAGFTHIANAVAANTHTSQSAGSTAPSVGGLTSTTAGDLAVGSCAAGGSPSVASQRDSLGNTMPAVGSTQTGQSLTGFGQWFVEAGGVLPNPAATLGTSQAWAMAGARFNNDGSTITHIASSDAGTGYLAAPGNKTFTINIPGGVTIPAGATLLLLVHSGGNTGANTISDNATGAGTAPTVTAVPTISGTVRRGQTLTVTDGTASGSPAPSVTARQWLRNGVSIGGATGTTYVLAAADDGATITVAVTWHNTTAPDAVGTSAATTAVSEGRTVVAQDARIEFCGNSMVADRNVGLPVFAAGASGPLVTQVETLVAAHIVPSL